MRFLFLIFVCGVWGCRPIEIQKQVDVRTEKEIYHQLTKAYPPLEADLERSASETAYEVARYPFLYMTGVLIYAPVQASLEEAPLLVGGISGTLYGDRWYDFWNEHRFRWEDWEAKTRMQK